jgi:CTP-dependent riboflavin kinase
VISGSADAEIVRARWQFEEDDVIRVIATLSVRRQLALLDGDYLEIPCTSPASVVIAQVSTDNHRPSEI